MISSKSITENDRRIAEGIFGLSSGFSNGETEAQKGIDSTSITASQ